MTRWKKRFASDGSTAEPERLTNPISCGVLLRAEKEADIVIDRSGEEPEAEEKPEAAEGEE